MTEKKLEVEIQVIIHATEDPQKIFDSFTQVFNLEKDDFSVQKLQGHYDNPIVLLNGKIKKKKATIFVKNLICLTGIIFIMDLLRLIGSEIFNILILNVLVDSTKYLFVLII